MPDIIYLLGKMLVKVYSKIILRTRIIGVDNIPAEGPVVIMSNHISLLDPPLIGAAIPRKIHYLAKEELFQNPLIGWVLKQLGAFPVKRGSGDIKAFKQALRILRSGGVLGVFPEGTRYPEGELGSPHGGSAAIAVRGGARIVPAAIKNIKTRGRPTVIFGKPLDILQEDKLSQEERQKIAEEIMAEIANLLEAAEE